MQKWLAPHIYYIRDAMSALNSGLILNSLWVFYIDQLHLSLTQLSLISIVITLTVVLAEIPTGIVADVFSRRLSVIIGGAFVGLCYTLIGLFPLFGILLLAAFIEAVGDSFVSGALQAWITDEVGVDRVGPIFLRSTQIGTIAHWVGIGLSIVLAALFGLRLPILIGGLSWFGVTAFLIIAMPERGFVRPAQTKPGASLQAHLREAVNTFAAGARLLRANRVLQLLFAVQVLLMVFFDSFYRLSRTHFVRSLSLPMITVPLLGTLKDNVWFGGFEAAQGMLVLIGAEGVRRKIDLNKQQLLLRVLLAFYGVVFVGVVVFAITGQFVVAVIAWLLANVLHQLAEPIISTWINQNIPADVRATVLSISSQANMLGVTGVNPIISGVGDRFGLRSGLLLTGVLLLPVLGLLGSRTKRNSKSKVQN